LWLCGRIETMLTVQVAELVCQSLQLDSTPVPRKIARLHLVSDILHNSASPLPNVWKYRLAFEKRLPAVFSHLNVVCQSLDAYSGKISADVFRGQVHAVLDVWDRWYVPAIGNDQGWLTAKDRLYSRCSWRFPSQTRWYGPT
jgi:hypothetical protein